MVIDVRPSDFHESPAVRSRLDLNLAVVLLDNPPTFAEAESQAATRLSAGEERIEGMLQFKVRESSSIVLQLNGRGLVLQQRSYDDCRCPGLSCVSKKL